MQQNIYVLLKNGYYIPLLFPLFYYATNDAFLSTTITLKLFPANYMFWYSQKFDYAFDNPRYNQIKQIVRFTDSGHLASILAIASYNSVPLAFNVHFAITFGYWIAKWALGLNDVDNTNGPEYDIRYESLWASAIHGVPLVFLLQKILNSDHGDVCPYYFSSTTLVASYTWLWVWFLWVYMPWRLRTGDAVYSCLEWKMPNGVKIASIVMIHLLLFVANTTGRFLYENCAFTQM